MAQEGKRALGKVAFGIESVAVMGGDRNGMGYSDRRSGTIDKLGWAIMPTKFGIFKPVTKGVGASRQDTFLKRLA
jgi:cephalosporin-C deacetylase-like acetyl esterase